MDRNERNLYKSGKSNPNRYHMKIRNRKAFFAICLAVFILLISCVMFVLEKTNVYSWNQLKALLGIVEGTVSTDADFSVYYLDVGQSDCSIIVCDDKVMMIDTGTVNRLTDIKSSLLTLNIDTIDYMIITHPHDDHMGCAASIINDYNVLNIIMPKLDESNMVTTDAYEEFLNAVINKKVTAIAAEPGYSFSLGSAKVGIFSPMQQDDNLNNMSVVTKIIYGETSFLFQGDAEKKVENALIKSNYDLSADVIKLGHHGSNTSSTSKYLNAVNPKAAIISCGADNSYGHPHGEVLKRLEDANIDAYITALSGSITVTSDGSKITVKSESGEEKVYE